MNTPRDENNIPVLQAVSMTDGVTVLPIKAEPVTHSLMCKLGGVGITSSNGIDPRDQDHVPAFMAVSSVDGVTPVPIYMDPVTNSLLISQ